LIRKEHVDVAMEFSRCARAGSTSAIRRRVGVRRSPTRRPHPPKAGRSFKAQQRAACSSRGAST